ncbi:MAG: Clp1/GlmU family protein [Thiohalorhabdus sp.]|uniref:Clp1/GlmU family protein n=1 Tax=Thiohalorhabdus sp. TaxID=3094134 RepID=UPI00397FADA4
MSSPPQPGEPPALDIPPDWSRAAEAVLAAGGRRIVVAGAADRGKSSFCRYLAARFLEAGTAAALLDADVGQKELGPPAALTLGSGAAAREPGEGAHAFYFVGAVSPRGHFLPVAVGSGRLLAQAGDQPVIVSTDGMVRGPGRILRHYQMEALAPDHVVALEAEGEAGSVPVPQGTAVHRLHPAPSARARNPAERKAARQRAFRAYFRDAGRAVLDLEGLHLERCLLFTGRTVDPGGFLHAEETPEGPLVVGNRPLSDRTTKRLPAGFERDLLCGVLDTGGRCLGLARLARLDFRTRKLTLWTPVPPDRIRGLQLGALYVDAEGRELARSRPRNL